MSLWIMDICLFFSPKDVDKIKKVDYDYIEI